MDRIAITIGDPTGIGPELVVRLLPLLQTARIYGDPGVLTRTAAQLGVSLPADLDLVPVSNLSAEESHPGRPGRSSGAAQIAYLEAAIADAQKGRVLGICTAPIHKASAIDAGLAFPGHTELLAERFSSKVAMMLAGPSLRVVLTTTHMALAEVPRALSISKIRDVLVLTVSSLRRDFGIACPRVLVAGLNPHAGEDGHFGNEEGQVIRPAIEEAAQMDLCQGATLIGPMVPDVVFRTALRRSSDNADAVVAMYHDQGLIPLKLLDFDKAVNVTLGLPIVRTSPDHGVAHDIAGKGLGRTTSMEAALRLCQDLVLRRTQKSPLEGT